jgi:hypothetical protein
MGEINKSSFLIFLVLLALQLQCVNSKDSLIFPIKLTYERIPLLQMKYFCSDL